MGDSQHLKLICIISAIILFVNSIFALVNKTTPNDQKEYPGQHMIISVIYMMMAVVLFFSALNLDVIQAVPRNYGGNYR